MMNKTAGSSEGKNYHIATFLKTEKIVSELENTTENLIEITKEHGSQIRELYRMCASSASKAELTAAVSSLRAQYLNGHIPTFNDPVVKEVEESPIHQVKLLIKSIEKDRKEENRILNNTIKTLEKEISILKLQTIEANLKIREQEISNAKKIEDIKNKSMLATSVLQQEIASSFEKSIDYVVNNLGSSRNISRNPSELSSRISSTDDHDLLKTFSEPISIGLIPKDLEISLTEGIMSIKEDNFDDSE